MDVPPQKENEESESTQLSIALKWMKPGASVAVPLLANPLLLPRDVTLSQLRDAILEQTIQEADFHDLVANQKFQMHFVYKGTILKEDETDDKKRSLLDLCKNVPSNTITLFVVLSNPPKPPKPPEVRPPVRPSFTDDGRGAERPTLPPRRHTPRSPPPPQLPAPLMEELQQQFPEHDIRDLVSVLLSHPDARAQMERSFDLQLAQLDHVPGGMNLLQSLYTQQQDQEERLLFSSNNNTSSNGSSSSSEHNANGASEAAAIAGATGQAMPNPWGSRHSNNTNRRLPPPPRRTLPTGTPPLPSAMFPTTTTILPNPWSNLADETEQLYETTTAPAQTTTTVPTDNPWRPVESTANATTQQEQLLYDMGFTNRALNRSLLQQHDWETTVDLLLQQQQEEENEEDEEGTGGANDNNDDAAAAVKE